MQKFNPESKKSGKYLFVSGSRKSRFNFPGLRLFFVIMIVGMLFDGNWGMGQEISPPEKLTLSVFADKTFYTGKSLLLTSKIKNVRVNLKGAVFKYAIHTAATGAVAANKETKKILLVSTEKIDIGQLPCADYNIEAAVFDRDGACLAKASTSFCKISPLDEKIPRLRISREGIPLLDGKPHLLRLVWLGGSWEGPIEKEELKLVAEQGFDSVVAGPVYMPGDALAYYTKYPQMGKGGHLSIVKRSKFKDFNQFLEALHEYGLTCFPRVGAVTSSFAELSMDNLKDTGKFILKYRNNPAVIGWYSHDETDAWVKTNRQVYNVIKEVDPCRPVLLNLIEAVDANKDSCDILSTDPYPVGKTKLTLVSAHGDRLVKCLRKINYKTPWLVLQMFGSPAEGWPRPPTPQEEKCMTYLALNHGVKGLIYFAHNRLATLSNSKRLTPQLWDSMKALNAETKEMALPYLAGKDLKGVNTPVKALDIAVKQYGKSIFVIAVNTLPKTFDAVVNISAVVGKKQNKAAVKFESREISVDNGILKDSFQPYGVHVYVIDSGQ
ncbi:MAG: beta-galactosidase [Victivallaceae bacterium]